MACGYATVTAMDSDGLTLTSYSTDSTTAWITQKRCPHTYKSRLVQKDYHVLNKKQSKIEISNLRAGDSRPNRLLFIVHKDVLRQIKQYNLPQLSLSSPGGTEQ